MTSQTSLEQKMAMHARRVLPDQDQWQLQEAKARLSEVVRKAQKKPQIITVRDEPSVVVISIEEYQKERLAKQQQKPETLLEFLQNSPLRGLDIDFERDRSLPREEDLF